jgi:hypothetical protein
MAKKMFRHGDVLLTQVNGIAIPGKKVKLGKQAILAEGEVTGHHHVITCERPVIADWMLDLHRYVKLDAPGVLDHPEHGRIDVPAGTYEVTIQRVYTPEAIRRVAD